METVLIIAAFVIVIVVLVFILVQIEKFWSKRRCKAILPRAVDLGFTKTVAEGFSIKEHYPPFIALTPAYLTSDFIIQRQLDGEKQQHIFNIELRSGQGQCEKITFCLIHLPGINLPTFLIKGQDKMRFTMRLIHDVSRSAQTFIYHYHPVPVSTSETFQKHYQLLAPEGRDDFQKIFKPELIQLFETHPEWQVEGMGEWLLFYRRGTLVKPSKFKDFVTESMTIADAFFKAAKQTGASDGDH
jgi:hypothetical protein